jgi:hypothetical protein
VPSTSISQNAASVSVHVGKAMLTGTLPAYSHRPSTNRIDAVRRTQGLPAQAATRLAR